MMSHTPLELVTSPALVSDNGTGAASALIVRLAKQGIRVQLSHGTDLRVRAPKGVLTEERKELIRAHKAELVEVLTCHPCARCEWGLFPNPGTICFHCRRAMQHKGGEAA